MAKSTNSPILDNQKLQELHEIPAFQKRHGLPGEKSELEIWNAFFPAISPQKLYRTLQSEVGPGFKVKVELEHYRDDRKNLLKSSIIVSKHDALTGANADVAKITFTQPNDNIDLEDIYLANVKIIDADQQGKHLIAGALKTIVGMLKEQGTQNIVMLATDVGSYAWVKYGFRPVDHAGWESLKRDLRQRFEDGNPPTVTMDFTDECRRCPITIKTRYAIENVLKSDDPAAIIHLTELNEVVGQHDDHDITVGKALLMGIGWHGILPLDENDRGYQQFIAYTDAAKLKEPGK